jgi:HSP20 family protein
MFRRWENLADGDLVPERFFSRTSGASFGSGFAPRVDISESDKDVKLTAEVPGLDERSLSVSAADDNVTIEGTKTQEKSSKVDGFQSVERSYGSFRRVVPLPCRVLGDKAVAGLKDGILTITIPKSTQARPKENKITITRL